MPATATLPVSSISRLFKALGDSTRLRIVAVLSHGELCVCHIEAALELSQPAASRHLSVLRHAGVVEARRDGSWIHYRLAPQPDAASARQLRALVAEFAREPALKRDLERLMKSKGPNKCP